MRHLNKIFKIIFKIVIVSAALVVGSVVAFAIYLAWPHSPSYGRYVANTSFLKGSQQLYQLHEHGYDALAPGDDSQVYTITRVQHAAAVRLLASSQPFKVCHDKTIACSVHPTWQPRSNFTAVGDQGYAAMALRSEKGDALTIYKAVISSPRTVCAAENLEAGTALAGLDKVLLCVEPLQNLVVLEYSGRNG